MQGSFCLRNLNFTCCKAACSPGALLKPARKEGLPAPIFATNRLEAAPAQGNSREVGVNRGFEPFHPHRESGEAISRYCASAKRIEDLGAPMWAGHGPPPISNCR